MTLPSQDAFSFGRISTNSTSLLSLLTVPRSVTTPSTMNSTWQAHTMGLCQCRTYLRVHWIPLLAVPVACDVEGHLSGWTDVGQELSKGVLHRGPCRTAMSQIRRLADQFYTGSSNMESLSCKCQCHRMYLHIVYYNYKILHSSGMYIYIYDITYITYIYIILPILHI